MKRAVAARYVVLLKILVIALCLLGKEANSQVFSATTNGNSMNVRACGISGAPNGCVGSTTSAAAPDMLYVVSGELADVRLQLQSLQASINSLKQSNEDAANATKQAANNIANQNSQFNDNFRGTILQMLQNYPADFVNSDAYKQLKNELMNYIDQKLAAQNPGGKQPAANPPQPSNSKPGQTSLQPTEKPPTSPTAQGDTAVFSAQNETADFNRIGQQAEPAPVKKERNASFRFPGSLSPAVRLSERLFDEMSAPSWGTKQTKNGLSPSSSERDSGWNCGTL